MLAATRTTAIAWTSRRSGAVTVLSPRDAEAGPRDAVAPVALVQLAAGAVSGITYREPEGWRTVTAAADASDPNRARALALVRDGDALAAAGDFTAALDRYDRASVVHSTDATLQYKIASSLDKLLRPVEAELRYKLFLNQLTIQRSTRRVMRTPSWPTRLPGRANGSSSSRRGRHSPPRRPNAR